MFHCHSNGASYLLFHARLPCSNPSVYSLNILLLCYCSSGAIYLLLIVFCTDYHRGHEQRCIVRGGRGSSLEDMRREEIRLTHTGHRHRDHNLRQLQVSAAGAFWGGVEHVDKKEYCKARTHVQLSRRAC